MLKNVKTQTLKDTLKMLKKHKIEPLVNNKRSFSINEFSYFFLKESEIIVYNKGNCTYKTYCIYSINQLYSIFDYYGAFNRRQNLKLHNLLLSWDKSLKVPTNVNHSNSQLKIKYHHVN